MKTLTEHISTLSETKAGAPNEIDKLAAQISKLTQRNDHGGAILILAKYLKEKKYEKILKAVNDIHEAEGSLPKEISDYRYRISKQLWDLVDKKFWKDDAKKIHGAF